MAGSADHMIVETRVTAGGKHELSSFVSLWEPERNVWTIRDRFGVIWANYQSVCYRLRAACNMSHSELCLVHRAWFCYQLGR